MRKHNPNCKQFRFQRCFLIVSLMISNAFVSQAQTPPGNAPDPLVKLVVVAETLIPKLQELIESPLIQGLENLAFWIAVIVMLLSFARLFRENDGASTDLLFFKSDAAGLIRVTNFGVATPSQTGRAQALAVQAKARAAAAPALRRKGWRGVAS